MRCKMIKKLKARIHNRRKARVIELLNKIKGDLTEKELQALEHTLSLYRHRKFD